jgi:hypothetical protein
VSQEHIHPLPSQVCQRTLQEQEAAKVAHTATIAAAAAGEKSMPKPKRSQQANLLKIISAQRRLLTNEERAHWENMAKEKKREHKQLDPNYIYCPQRKEPKKAANAQPASKKGKGCADTNGSKGSVELTIPFNRHARATCADSAYTAQTIHLPIVNILLPSYMVNSPCRSSFADWPNADDNVMMPAGFVPRYQVSSFK